MRCISLMITVAGLLLGGALKAQEACSPPVATVVDPRIWVEIGALRVCGAPRQDDSVAQRADVLVWESGEATWARKAAFMQPGVVTVAIRQEGAWRAVRELRSPEPAAYGAFGAQLASNGRWLAVLSRRPQSVWMFDLSQPDDTGLEVRGVRGFAQSVAALGDRLVVGGPGEARIFTLATTWTLVERVAAPSGAANTFGGQIVAQDELLVSSVSGVNNGDAGVLPGRVDVYRRDARSGWRWEGQLRPRSDMPAFGHDCCVALDRGQIVVATGGQRWRFVREAAGWRVATGAAP